MSNLQGLSVDEKQLKRTEAIVLSMTNEERTRPDILNARRRQAHRPRERQQRHGGERSAPALRSNAKDDEERGQNEKNDGANGANENLIWQFQSDYEEKARKIARITKWWWPTAAARATGNSSRSSGPTIRRSRSLTARLKLDRIEHWIARGAQPSDTVRSLIKKNKENGGCLRAGC